MDIKPGWVFNLPNSEHWRDKEGKIVNGCRLVVAWVGHRGSDFRKVSVVGNVHGRNNEVLTRLNVGFLLEQPMWFTKDWFVTAEHRPTCPFSEENLRVYERKVEDSIRSHDPEISRERMDKLLEGLPMPPIEDERVCICGVEEVCRANPVSPHS